MKRKTKNDQKLNPIMQSDDPSFDPTSTPVICNNAWGESHDHKHHAARVCRCEMQPNATTTPETLENRMKCTKEIYLGIMYAGERPIFSSCMQVELLSSHHVCRRKPVVSTIHGTTCCHCSIVTIPIRILSK